MSNALQKVDILFYTIKYVLNTGGMRGIIVIMTENVIIKPNLNVGDGFVFPSHFWERHESISSPILISLDKWPVKKKDNPKF